MRRENTGGLEENILQCPNDGALLKPAESKDILYYSCPKCSRLYDKDLRVVSEDATQASERAFGFDCFD